MGGPDKRHPRSWGGGRAGGHCPLGVPGACVGAILWPQWAGGRDLSPPAYPQLRTHAAWAWCWRQQMDSVGNFESTKILVP